MSLESIEAYDHFSIVFGDGPNGVDIGLLVDGVTAIDRGIGNQWNNEYTRGLGRYGKSWVRGSLGSKTISVEFVKDGDQLELAEFRRKLATALDCPKGPKKLTFNDQPNTYYMAVTDGTISLREDISMMRATGVITFIVPDGLLHASTITTLDAYSDPDTGHVIKKSDHVEVLINNTSSVEVYPKITIKHNDENGWIGIANQNGVLELGSKTATAQGDAVLSDSVSAITPLRIKNGEQNQWALFNKEASIGETLISSPHDSNMNVRIGEMVYESKNVAFTVGSAITNTTAGATKYSVGPIPNKTQTYQNGAKSKGFAAKLVVTYISTDAASKTSVVHADLYIVNVDRVMSFTEWDINYTVKIGDTAINHRSRPNMAPQYGGSWEVKVMSNDYTVKHNVDGSASVFVQGAVNGNNQAYYVPGYFQTTGTFELPNITTTVTNTTTAGGYPIQNQTVAGLTWKASTLPNSAYKWAGSIATYTLPTDTDGNIQTAKNFRCDFNVKIWQKTGGKTGRITVGFLDKNDQIICAYDIYKDDMNGEDTTVNFYTGKDSISQSLTFGANNGENDRTKPNIAFNNRTGNASVTKEGSKVTFTYADKPYSFNLSKLENKECAKIYISAGALYASRDLNKMIDVMTIESISFTNTNSQRYDNLPNRYKDDTKIVVDLYEGEVMLYPDPKAEIGQKAQSELVHGSRFFSVPSGTSYLRIYVSSWSRSLPDVSLEWQDMWL